MDAFGNYRANLTIPSYPPAISGVTQFVAGNPTTLGTTGLPSTFAFDTVGKVAYFTADGTTWSAVGGGSTGGGGLVGSGSPEGVQTAAAGTTYYDTVGFGYWVKGSGSGNTGWVELIGG